MKHIVTVNGIGEASGVPDVLRLSLGLEGRGPDVGAALDAASAAVERVLGVARERGIADTDLATASITVQPRFDQDGRRVGYESHQRLRLTVRDLTISGELMRAAADAAGDALSIDDLTLAVADPSPLLSQARDEAFADARRKAEQYARLAGRELGVVAQVSEATRPLDGPRPSGRAYALAASAVPVEPGEQSVHAAVSVTWTLLD